MRQIWKPDALDHAVEEVSDCVQPKHEQKDTNIELNVYEYVN